MVIRSRSSSEGLAPWEIYGEDIPEEEQVDGPTDASLTESAGAASLLPSDDPAQLQSSDMRQLGKRPLSSRDVPPDPASPPRKRARAGGCTAPQPDPHAQRILAKLRDPSTEPATGILEGAGDIFMTYGWRNRWCRCDSVRFFSLVLQHLC